MTNRIRLVTDIWMALSLVLMIVWLVEQYRPIVVCIVIATTVSSTLNFVIGQRGRGLVWVFNTLAWTALIVNNYVPLAKVLHWK